MVKRSILAILAVFVAWWLLELLIHWGILSGDYQATAALWRPEPEMKRWLLDIVGIVSAAAFVLIYACLVGEKCVANGLKYGLLYGIGAGVSMGMGSYAVMQITCKIAWVWCIGVFVEMLVGGLLVGLIVKEKAEVKE